MKFEFEGLSYAIEFKRENRVPSGSNVAVPRPYTTARIVRLGEDKADRTIVREYTVGWNPHDRFSYEAGRKIALTRAMFDAPTKSGGEPLMGTTLSREFRTAVWEAYFGRFVETRVSAPSPSE